MPDRDDNEEKANLRLVEGVKEAYEKSARSELNIGLPEREVKNWLMSYLEYTKHQESPESFHLWSAISVIGAMMKRNAFMDRGHYILYPNIYIVLVGASAIVKKSTAIDIAESFARKNKDIMIQGGKVTPEGLITRMATNIKTVDGKIIKDGYVYIIVDEMSVMLSNVAYVSGLSELLVDFHKCRDEWPYTTKHSPVMLHNIGVSLLGGSTPEWLATGMPEYHKSGGFLGRFVFVVEHKPRKKISFPEVDERGKALRGALERDIETISKLKGDFEITPEARSMYDKWYQKYEPGEDPRLREYQNRKPDLVLKLSMIFSSSTSNRMIVDTQHIRASFTILESVERHMVDAFVFLGSTLEHQQARLILSILNNSGRLSRRLLLRSIAHRVRRVGDFNEILEMLRQEGRIKKEVGKKGETFYRMTSDEERLKEEEDKRRKAGVLSNIFNKDGSFK